MSSWDTTEVIKFLIAVAVISGLFLGIGCTGDIQRKRDHE